MRRKVKRTFVIHHWCGLIAGIFILAISISGVVLVFDDEIDRAAFSKYFSLDVPAGKLKIDSSIQWVSAKYPDWDIRIPALPQTSNEALLYELRKGHLRKWLFVHPGTGEEIALVDQAHKRFSYVALNIHYNLLAGTAGKVVVLFIGIALLVLTITGFVLYRRSVWKVLCFRQRLTFISRRAFFSSLHRVIGVWALIFNLLMCVTGLSLAITVVNSAFKGPVTQPKVPFITSSVDSIMAEANGAYPDFNVTYVRFPLNESGNIQLLGRLSSDPLYYGRLYSKVPANFRTGELGAPYFVRDQVWYVRLLTALHPLHFGDYAGVAVQIVYAFFGLMPGLLSVSGFFTWRLRRKGTHLSADNSRPRMRRGGNPVKVDWRGGVDSR